MAGATLLTPVVNYWWPGFPSNLSTKSYYDQLLPDQWTLRVGHYLPWLTYWWNTQKYFPSSSVAAHSPDIFKTQDMQLAPRFAGSQEKYRVSIPLYFALNLIEVGEDSRFKFDSLRYSIFIFLVFNRYVCLFFKKKIMGLEIWYFLWLTFRCLFD